MEKNVIFFAVAIFLSLGNSAAQTVESGSVVYTETVKLEIKLEGEMAAMMKDLPNERTSEKILWFNPGASMYQNYSGSESPATGGMWQGEGNISFYISEPENKIYTDITKKELIEQKEFMTRMFLIKKDMPENDWKITGNQEMILNYPCTEALKSDTGGVVTRIWFTPLISIPAGPELYNNLPGLVLKVDIDNGKKILLAKSISLEEPDKDVFEKPKKGKEVTQDEYDTIVAEKMKEMGAEAGGTEASTVVIRIKK